VLPDVAVPNREVCQEGDCPALGGDWDGETRVPWFKRRLQQEKERKEREETNVPERFRVRKGSGSGGRCFNFSSVLCLCRIPWVFVSRVSF
jgi:hypothetical protein